MTPELTGNDAPLDQAQFGSAGNGADYVSDLIGTTPESLSPEQEAENEDVLPDHIESFQEPSEDEEEERELTAQPNLLQPIDISELP